MAIEFPADPAAQTPVNKFSPTSTPLASPNNVEYTWDGEKWVAYALDNTADFEDIFVEVAGDDMSGNLTLGTDKIVLDAGDGSITAEGDITTNGDVSLFGGDLNVSKTGATAEINVNTASGTVDSPQDVDENDLLLQLTVSGRSGGQNVRAVKFDVNTGDEGYGGNKTFRADYIGKGETVIIVTTGDTDYTLLGAPDSNPGTIFTSLHRGWDKVQNTTGTVKSLDQMTGGWQITNANRGYSGMQDNSVTKVGRSLHVGSPDASLGVNTSGLIAYTGISGKFAKGNTGDTADTNWHNTGVTFPNASQTYLVQVNARGSGNLIACTFGIVVSAAYNKKYFEIGKANHYGNGTISLQLSTSEAATVNLQFKFDSANYGNFEAHSIPLGGYSS